MGNFNNLILLDEYLFLNVMVRNLELFKTFISMSIQKKLTKVEVNDNSLSESALIINAIGDDEYDVYFKIVSTDDITHIRDYYENLMFEKYVNAKLNHQHTKKSFLLLISTDDPFLDNQCKHTIIYECKESPSVAESFPETIIFYPYGEKNNMDKNLVEFMEYLAGATVNNEYIATIEQAIYNVKKSMSFVESYIEFKNVLDKYSEQLKTAEFEIIYTPRLGWIYIATNYKDYSDPIKQFFLPHELEEFIRLRLKI